MNICDKDDGHLRSFISQAVIPNSFLNHLDKFKGESQLSPEGRQHCKYRIFIDYAGKCLEC